MSETWDDLFGPFEGQHVLLNVITNEVAIKDLRIFLVNIYKGDHSLTLNLRGNQSLEFKTEYNPVIDENGNLSCYNAKNGYIRISKSPLQTV